ncbi:TonB-dependent receptor [Subsaxibacter sp. CAU 1640]|uniref:TonB-dependent receptor n=1 Tax=Subsaxibacter sp. CAU 1640 TaxID=2933271 RepID=UPI0020055B9B|nr:TonB-dependent receptor [Subsaxibacter sp. CAU 1640]MCK7592007.1 TonB-dependent receptor [Subsaxibacter sp. CAU 1640]
MQPLSNVLKHFEERFQVHFTYLDKAIEGKTASLPSENFNLEQALEQLSSETNLDFIVVDEHSVVISVRTNPFSEFIVQKLEEVVVQNFLTKGISKKSDGKITIDTEDFDILPGLTEPDVLQSIQALPGILSVDETVSNINVRGGTHDQNLILWDGIKMYQSGHFFGLVSAFNPYLTKRVNVSKNGTSVKYGDGVSSVIDMQQSNALNQNFDAGAGFNLLSASGFAKIPLSKKTEVQISARRSITDFIFTPTYDQYLKRVFEDSDFTNSQQNNGSSVSSNEHFYFYDVSTKFLYDVTDSDQLRFNFASINNNLNYDESSTVNSVTRTSESNLQQTNLATGLEYLKYWNANLTTTAQIYLSNYDLDANNANLTDDFNLIQENKVKDLGLKLNATNHIDENLKLHSGYQFSEVSVSNTEVINNPDFNSFSKRINRSHAIYSEAEFTSGNKNSYARIGLRINYVDRFSEFYTEPRIAVSHKFSNALRLEFLAEFKSQTISQIIDLQDDFLGIEKRRWILSDNEEVPMIESKQASIGLHYNKNKLLLSAEAFVKDVSGITSRSQGFQNQYQFVNEIGSYQTKGIDLLVNKQFDSFSAWLSYSFSTNDYKFENLNNGNSFPNNVDVRHAATLAATYNYKAFKMALGLNYRSGRPTTLPLENQSSGSSFIEYDTPNDQRISEYIRTDFSAIYQFQIGKKTKATVGASVWNILNRKNILNSYFILNDDDTISKIENRSLGITPNISFRLWF